MKKTLLALAAIAASSASFAQSSVTLYGVVDVSLESVKGDKTVTRVTSSNYNTSRLGFKGTEDIGGGLKANFALESGIAADTGAQGNTARFFDRASWVGLAGGFGDLRLGRIDTLIGDIAGVVSGVGPQNYDALKIVGTRAGDSLRRADNAVTYFLPTLVPGLTAALQYSTAAGSSATGGATGAEAAGDNNGKSYGLSVKYAAGPLSAGLGYENLKDNSATAGNQKANATIVYAGYDFGVAKATLYYDAETNPTLSTTNNRRLTVLGTTVNVPLSPEFALVLGAAQARNVNGAVAGNDNVEITSIKGVYSLSKRTAVYGLFTGVNNGSATGKGPGITSTIGADKTTHGLAVGIRHTF